VSLISYFTDPLLRGPTIGSLLMCATSAMIGVVAVLRRRALLGESLSHASYPGVLVALLAVGTFYANPSDWQISLTIFFGACGTSLLGLLAIRQLEKRGVRSDSALCFVLASFFGLGLLLASHLQFSAARWYRVAQAYLYGQTATMTDADAWVYGGLAFAVALVLAAFYKEIQVLSFDAEYAKTLGRRVVVADWIFTLLLVGSIVVGLRSVGVVLMSAMLIIPCVTARQLCSRLPFLLLISALIGAISAFLGVVLSVEGSDWMSSKLARVAALPTGPVIVLAATTLCLTALLFAPEKGLVFRFLRMAAFRLRCGEENLLKWLWRSKEEMNYTTTHQAMGMGKIAYYWTCLDLSRQGWIRREGKGWR
jgi:manganese/zinc/iron transport system permease protein